jgi:hypothetical protein
MVSAKSMPFEHSALHVFMPFYEPTTSHANRRSSSYDEAGPSSVKRARTLAACEMCREFSSVWCSHKFMNRLPQAGL